MKKIAAILLAAVFFFNWFGYRLLTDFLQHRADQQLEARLDHNDYDESQLIEMRVPLNMPYQVASSDFERIDGEIEINGIHYKYVKRKVDNGELVLMCVPNQAKMRLQSARDEFFKLVHDLQNPVQNKSSQPVSTVKSPVTEYWQQQNDWVIQAFEGLPRQYAMAFAALPAQPVINFPAQPPDC